MDGARSPADLTEAAARQGWNAIALADSNNLYGLPELVDAAAAAGIKALAGASIETGGIALRAYCLNRGGFSRLCAILSRVLAVEVPRRRQRLPRELLLEETAGYDETGNLLLAEGHAAAGEGEGRFAVQGPRHRRREAAAPGCAGAQGGYDPLADLAEGGWEGLALSAESPQVLRRLAGRGLLYAGLPLGTPQVSTSRLARELSLPILAEHQARFVDAADSELWRLARSIEERRSLAAIEREGLADPPGALLVPSSRAADFLSAFPEAQANAASLAEEAEAAGTFFASPPVFPAYQGMSDEESFRLLRSLCLEGIDRRFGPAGRARAELAARLERELRIIRDKGFSAYFLVVRDIVLRCPRTCGRGSAASSLVSYLLALTHVDPLEHELFFERFLNEGRTDPPDIDIDFPWDERPGVLAAVFRDYEGRAAMVADHCGFSDLGAIRESALALGMNEKDLKAARLAYRVGRADELPPKLRRLARMVHGMPRYIGMHPGGIVVTPLPITDYTHVQPSPSGLPVLAWEKDGTERAGLVKIDILGNRSLAVLRDCIELSNAARPPGEALAWDFPGAAEDKAARDLVEAGKSMGVFYIESPATRQLLLKMGMVDYRRLVVASSIIRPAANKYINEYVRRLHGGSWRRFPATVEKTLEETLGIIVYQEDVSRVAMAAAGFGAVEADGLRKVLTKKKKGTKLQDFRERFLAGCAGHAVPRLDADELWEMMLSFEGYSFCKAHSASYALVSYRLAWMKAHYPGFFIASVINNGGGFYGTQAYVGEARRLGLEVLSPHVNSSGYGYRVEEGALRVGLMQVSGLSRPFLDRLLATREASGPFLSLEDFYLRCRPSLNEARSLVRSGCLDGLCAAASMDATQASGRPGSGAESPPNGEAEILQSMGASEESRPLTRPESLWALHRLRVREPAGASLQVELLDEAWRAPAGVKDYSASVKLADEARLLGLVVSRIPASLFAGRASLVANRHNLPPPVPSSSLAGLQGRRVSLAGTAIAGKEVLSKDGKTMAFYTFEDETGLFETVLFPQAYARTLPTLEWNTAILVVGIVRSEFGALSLHVEEAYGLNRPDQDGAA